MPVFQSDRQSLELGKLHLLLGQHLTRATQLFGLWKTWKGLLVLKEREAAQAVPANPEEGV